MISVFTDVWASEKKDENQQINLIIESHRKLSARTLTLEGIKDSSLKKEEMEYNRKSTNFPAVVKNEISGDSQSWRGAHKFPDSINKNHGSGVRQPNEKVLCDIIVIIPIFYLFTNFYCYFQMYNSFFFLKSGSRMSVSLKPFFCYQMTCAVERNSVVTFHSSFDVV